MTAQEVIDKAFVILGDSSKTFWTNTECLDYLNEGLVEISEATRHLKKRIEVLLDGSSSYNFPDDFIVLDDAWDSSKQWSLEKDTYETKDNDYSVLMLGMTTYRVNNPNDVTLTLDYFATQGAVALDDDVPLPSDIVEGMKYYIISKAFLKDIATKDEATSASYYAEYQKYENKMKTRTSKFYTTEVSTSGYQGY